MIIPRGRTLILQLRIRINPLKIPGSGSFLYPLKSLKAISPPEWVDFVKYYTPIRDLYQVILIGYLIFSAPSLTFLSQSCAKVSWIPVSPR